MKLTRNGLRKEAEWRVAGIGLPRFDIDAMLSETNRHPRWVHFGAGNIFRGYIAALQQRLLELGRTDTGIVAVAPYDDEIIRRVCRPYDNLTLQVIMNADGTLDKTVIAGVGAGLAGGSREDWERLSEIFMNPSLQLASFTVTEKGYGISRPDGTYTAEVTADLTVNRLHPKHVMAQAAALLYRRYQSGRHPIALVSMDNCARNGDLLREVILRIAGEWVDFGLAEEGFLAYLKEDGLVAFPCSMIDKITPRPSPRVRDSLVTLGLESCDILETAKHTFAAPFVNAERTQYLVIEDRFPNGRPPLEDAGVYFTDRASVEKAERMKVTACLNPLHTALAVFGCLLGFTLIADEMKDPELSRLVRRLGYDEGLPVVDSPGIFKPEAFLEEVLGERLPNPNIPDTPQRIATDTSRKVGVRYGETIRAHIGRRGDAGHLTCIPLVIAGWCRYLMGTDDNGDAMDLSPDPLLDALTACFSGASGCPQPEDIRPILSDGAIFGVDLYAAGLGTKIEGYFRELTSGPGAVRRTLQKYMAD